MSRQRIVQLVPWAALLTAFTAGAAWAVQSQRVDNIDTRVTAIETDGTYVKRGQFDSLLMELRYIRASGDSTGKRVREMWCAGKQPAGCR